MYRSHTLTRSQNTDSKLLIYGLFQKGLVLAQDGVMVSKLSRVDHVRPLFHCCARNQIMWEPAIPECAV